MNTVWEKRRKRLFEIIEIGSNYDAVCWGYDFLEIVVSYRHIHMPHLPIDIF